MKTLTKKTMPIGKKIIFSFALILGLILILGAFSNIGVRGIVGKARQVIDGNRLDGILARKEVDHLMWANKLNALLTDDNITTLDVETDYHKCGLGKWLYGEGRKNAEKMVPSLAPLLIKLEDAHARLHQSAIDIEKVFKPADPLLPARLVAIETEHLRWLGRIRNALINKKTNLDDVQKDPTQCSFGKWITTPEAQDAYKNAGSDFRATWDEIPGVHNQLHKSALVIEKMMAKGDFKKAQGYLDNVIKPLQEETGELFQDLAQEAEQELAGQKKAEQIYTENTLPALVEVQQILGEIRQEVGKNLPPDRVLLITAERTKTIITILSALALICGVFLSFFISRSIIKALQAISNRMDVGANQVAAAAMQVSAASNSLADGSSQQAAALEQISSSLEEVASMTRNDADNAKQADNLMKEAAEIITESDNSMKKLTVSMQEISAASEQTQKVVKTIDEIAFQTNLLALNAAVEAARAGEAGAGFAVVADEVRNLAMRAADSAKSTSALIGNTVEKINKGSGLVDEASESFYVAAQATGRISTLVAEIAGSTGEQALAIQQINRAVNEIDSVTQQNAATAEEAASASEELQGQAESSQDVVKDLVLLVGGMSSGLNVETRVHSRSHEKFSPPQKTDSHTKKLSPPSNTAEQQPETNPSSRSPKINPEKVIPMDDDDFKDF